MTTLNKSDLQKCAEQSGLQVDGRSEFAYTDRLEQFSRLIRLDLELEITYLRDQLAKAGQRVAKWQPISTAPKDEEVFIGAFIDGEFRFGKAVCFYEHGNEFEGEFYRGWFWSIDDVCESVADCPTHWMPLPKPPAMSQGEQK